MHAQSPPMHRAAQNHGVTAQKQQEAVDLLLSASGLRLASPSKDLARLQHRIPPDPARTLVPLEGFHGASVAEDAHPGALRELAKIFRVSTRMHCMLR
jgi:hypothetical protein